MTVDGNGIQKCILKYLNVWTVQLPCDWCPDQGKEAIMCHMCHLLEVAVQCKRVRFLEVPSVIENLLSFALFVAASLDNEESKIYLK